MKLYWLCEYAQKSSELKVAKNINDLFQKISEEIDKDFEWIKNNYKCVEICEVDGYRIILEKIRKTTDCLEDKVWIEEIQETFK